MAKQKETNEVEETTSGIGAALADTLVELQAPDGVATTVIEGVTYKVNNGVVVVSAQHKAMLLESFGYTVLKKGK